MTIMLNLDENIADYPELLYSERIVLNGNVYDVTVEQYKDGTIVVEHTQVKDYHPDQEIPF